MAQVQQFVDKVRETWLTCFGHMQRRDWRYSGQRMLNVEMPIRSNPQKRFTDIVKETMKRVGVTVMDAEDR